MTIPYQIVNDYIDFNRFGRFEIVKQAETIEELCDTFVLMRYFLELDYWDRSLFELFKSMKNPLYESVKLNCANPIDINVLAQFGLIKDLSMSQK